MQLDPIGEAALDIIERERPLRVPRDLYALPGREVVVNLASRGVDLCLNGPDFRIEVEFVLVGMVLQILQTPLQFEDWFLEIEWMRFHFVSR